MGSIAISVITDHAAQKLLDETFLHWTSAELLRDYNAVLRALASIKPDAFVTTANKTLTANVARQTIPTDGARFKRVLQWRGTSGTTEGAPVKQYDRDDLDHNEPTWRTTAGSAVEGFVPDDDPLTFHVFPPVASGVVLLEYYAAPTVATATNQTFPLADTYGHAVLCGVMALALAKNTKAADPGRAAWWLAQFNQALGLKVSADELTRTRGALVEQAKEKS